jgi:hypothetical protein
MVPGEAIAQDIRLSVENQSLPGELQHSSVCTQTVERKVPKLSSQRHWPKKDLEATDDSEQQ